jgi:hypothetical protein
MMSIEPTVAHFKVLSEYLKARQEVTKISIVNGIGRREEMVSAYVLKYAKTNTHRSAETKETF